MARNLTVRFGVGVALAFALPVLLLIGLVDAGATSYYNKISTGYAFGSYEGASVGWGQLTTGHFANHSTLDCPGDPAASWPFGTWITSVSPAPYFIDGNGSESHPTSYMLRDIGDPSCSKGNYWVDFYFGRWKMPADVCACGNETELCYDTQLWVNNCNDAWNWGQRTISYDGP